MTPEKTRPDCLPFSGLSRKQKAALAPFLRCLGVRQNGEWDVMRGELADLGTDEFVALHWAFRPYMTFSDVYAEPEDEP